MSTVNPMIPLSGNSGFDVPKFLEVADEAQQMRQRQSSIQKQNALAGLLSNQQSYDANGNLTQQAKLGMNALSPEFAMRYKQQQIDAHVEDLKARAADDDHFRSQVEMRGTIAFAADKVYEETLKATGGNQQAANEAGKKIRDQMVQESGSLFGKDFVDKALSSPYDPQITKSFKRLMPGEIQDERLAERDKIDTRRLDIEEKKLGEETRYHDIMEVLKQAGIVQRGNELNPKTRAFDEFLKEHPNATAKEQSDFIQTTGQAPRSPTAMAMRKFLDEHPDATAADLIGFNADMRATAKATSDFATGKQGQAINSFNVGTSHLKTLDDLASALNNGDMRTFNRIGNAWAKETGNDAPTNFDAAKTIVGDEVVKAIVGAGGTGADREKAQAAIDRANNPAQLHGAIQTVYKLMGGQLKGLQQQYEQTTKKKDFLDRLSPEAKKALLGDEGSGLKPGDKFKHPSGATVEILN